MSAIKRYGTTRRWSEASVVNGMVFVAGQLADDTSLPFELQLAQTFAAIERALNMANSNRAHLLSATIYMKDLAHMNTLNAAWDAWIPAGTAPGRTTVKADMVDPQCLVEITVTAAVKS
jgi:enamine deaminase RidA (YjgF/YER057c/UK114 family)